MVFWCAPGRRFSTCGNIDSSKAGLMHDRGLLFLSGGVNAMLLVASLIGAFASRRAISDVAAGDTDKFLERTAKIQWGLMICVYCSSLAPQIDVGPADGAQTSLLSGGP